MLQLDRWLTGDDYAIKLEDDRRLSLASLLTAAGRERSLILKRLFAGGARRGLATVISSSVARTTQKVREHRNVARNPAKNICSTIDYRTDAALGHVAGKPSDAQTLSVGAGIATNANGKIAA